MTTPPVAFVHGFSFEGFRGVVAASSPAEVIPALSLVEQRIGKGLHAAGFIGYEAASGLNPDLTTLPPGRLPLLWFVLFEKKIRGPFSGSNGRYQTSDWTLSTDRADYLDAVHAVRNYIAAGDCYQVNLTLRQRFTFSGDPEAFFADLCRSQPTRYASYLEAGDFRILSASPELFFALDRGRVTVRPMKGTARRGRWSEEDARAKATLQQDPKERAENLMIVDLLRNDLGIISETGSVEVESLFDVETLRTVHQMTSTVSSELRHNVSLVQLFQALFPCGSITGAPKRRSMEIIAQLERAPRGVYTGCIGYLSPGGEAEFSVAIRTVELDLATGRGELGIGSGITYDSKAEAEFAECLAKGRFARERVEDFHLIESLLWDREYFLLERHLQRLARSAAYFDFRFDIKQARSRLKLAAVNLTGPHKVRLLLFEDGRLECESAPLAASDEVVPVAFAKQNVIWNNPLLYHKTSLRTIFSEELAQRPECAEVLFTNDRGEVTEGSYSTIVARIAGELVTPALDCGLLPGVFREELLEAGEIRERVLTKQDLEQAEELFVVNSVRKWRRATLIR